MKINRLIVFSMFVFIIVGFSVLHIFLEYYIWRKWRKNIPIIYEFISLFLYTITAFILVMLIYGYFKLKIY